MKIATEKRDVHHPKGKICLDKGGEFLKMRKGADEKKGWPTNEPWKDLFLKEAFFLYEQKDKILSDTRMFFTPLPFSNNLAYTGTSGLSDATLGIYLEWWDDCEQAVIKNDEEVYALTFFIAGSPLSGSNRCSAVNRNGKEFTIQFSSFLPIWTSFMRINQRYDEAKQIYQAYTLEETVSKLREQFIP
jgi:hypothetical protein